MERINVTKTFLPPLEEYQAYLKQIWSNDQLTNQGPLLAELEKQLRAYLGVTNLHFVANGTLALQLGLRALDITEGEVITTPFSYVATTSSILWEHCEPVFVDIDSKRLCIDADKIEAAITPRTRAIMPVHVFGNPCDVEKIDAIAKKHNLKVIYDAAHAFGVKYKGKSLLDFGDISIASFHATKLFHTIEGGCVITRDKAVSDKVELLKHFGHRGDEHVMLGINGKASEFQAAMGLCNLPYIGEIIQKRKAVADLYDTLLGSTFEKPQLTNKDVEYNYGYYPILFTDEQQLQIKLKALSEKNIFPRRYFYPSLNTLPYLKNTESCPISEDIAVRIVCLPLHSALREEDVRIICEILKR
jgi:dTDP-4-amino-4,6-dideoxygalactose transaminase